MESWDVVIVGAGYGGLCAGALLAHGGKKVLVLGGGNVAFDCGRVALRLGADEVHHHVDGQTPDQARQGNDAHHPSGPPQLPQAPPVSLTPGLQAPSFKQAQGP